MRRSYLISSIVIFLVAVAGCGLLPEQPLPPKPLAAPIHPRVAFDTLVDSNPRGVRCSLSGGSGKTVTISTPRLVAMYELAAPVMIRCFADGFWTSEIGVLEGSRKALLIRIVDGEQIAITNAPTRGFNVGMGGKFPRAVTIKLFRNSFESAQKRDEYYAQHLAEISGAWKVLADQVKEECEDQALPQVGRSAMSRSELCRAGLHRLTSLEKADLQVVEQRRRRSAIP